MTFMDVRNWSMDQIMQLPDSCFGTRFLVSANAISDAGEAAWDISELGFPETVVIWEFSIFSPAYAPGDHVCRIALGDQLPATTAAMGALEPLLPGFGAQGAGPRNVRILSNTPVRFNKLRVPIRAGGRRLIVEIDPAAEVALNVEVMLVVSSIPTEVPDCLLSA